MIKCCAYIRVSTETQTTDNQLPGIEALCKAKDWQLVRVYSESASAWAGGQQSQLKRCIKDAQHNHFSVIIVWSLDRLSREGPLKVLSLIDSLHRSGIKLVSVQEYWTESAGDFSPVLLAITAWVAEWESKRRSERTKAGQARARAAGKGRRGPDKHKRCRRWLKRPVAFEPILSSVADEN
jgi:DNA invertase Pin-like site-specific DNA recombinase